jgi:hypothetical protein
MMFTAIILVVTMAIACMAMASCSADDRDMQPIWARAESIFGVKGDYHADGTATFDVPRDMTVKLGNVTLPPYMDISTEVYFQPLGNGKALAIGEYVLEENELEPVIRSLSGNGFEVDAIHSHLLTEQPRLFYLHTWATGDAEQLAKGIWEALDRTNSLTG